MSPAGMAGWNRVMKEMRGGAKYLLRQIRARMIRL